MNSIKKSIFWLEAVTGCMLLTLSIWSCGGDDDNDGGESNRKVVIDYSAEFGNDFLSFYDVTVTYLDKNGVEKTEAVTSSPWKYQQTMSRAEAPANYECTMTAKQKAVLPEIPAKGDLSIYSTGNAYSYINKESIVSYGTGWSRNSSITTNIATFLEKNKEVPIIKFVGTKK